MPPKSRTAYCDLWSYVQDRHPELANAFNDTCLREVLSRGGVTLIVPKNAKQLADSALSDDPAAISTTRELLLAHVLHSAHKDVGASKEANTRQGQPRAVKLMKKGTDGVTILSGAGGKSTAHVKIATDFVDSSARGNNAVWIIESGEISPDGPVVDISRAKKGGGATASFTADPSKQSIDVLTKVKSEICASGSADAAREVAARVTRGIAVHIAQTDSKAYYSSVLPNLGRSFYDLFVLLDPHWDNRPATDAHIKSWISAGCPTATHEEFMKTVDDADARLGAIYGRTSELAETLTTVRTSVLNASGIEAKIKAIEAVYEKLASENAVGSETNVFPAGVKLAGKLADDDLAFWLDVSICSAFESSGEERHATIKRVFAEIASELGSEDAPRRKITSSVHYMYKISPSSESSMIDKFVNSVYFVAYPIRSSMIAKVSNYQSPKIGSSDSFYNPHYGRRASPMTGGCAWGGRVAAALKRAGVPITDAQLAAIESDM